MIKKEQSKDKKLMLYVQITCKGTSGVWS